MTLYKHFPTKEALVEAFLFEKATATEALLRDIDDTSGLSTRDQILAIFDTIGKQLLCEEYRGCPMINAAVESADKRSNTFCAVRDYKAKFEEAIRTRVQQLGVADPEMLTQQLMVISDGVAVRAQLGFARVAVPAARSAAARLIDEAPRV